MSEAAALQSQMTKAPLSNSHSSLVQRKCACGGSSGLTGSCSGCEKKKLLTKPLQTKLRVNDPGDAYEQEADRVANQVIAMPAHRTVSGAPSSIQRLLGESNGRIDAAPGSVDQALACPGRPLEPAFRQGMEERFGYDFSRVRLHTGAAAAQSARDVNAHAYTVRHEIVFGEGRYSPRTLEGQRLLVHELVHTLQQSKLLGTAGMVQRQESLDIALRIPTLTAQILGAEIVDGFKLNSHTLTAEHKRRLLALAKRLTQLLREHQSGTVEITGHTDATGEEAFNNQLGQARADAVAAFLRAAGVPAIVLLAQSAGESTLRVPIDKPEPRNRRVEIRFLPEVPTPAPGLNERAPDKPPEERVQIPLPENLCTERPDICDPITTKPEAMPSCRPTNCAAVSGDLFDKLPPDLQLVLTKSFRTDAAAWFENLGEDRMALTQIFNRMCDYGVWCHVRLVLKIAPAEAPVLIADGFFDVPGRTASVFFTSPAGDALIEALMATGRFCKAYGAGASQHPGQTTLREISGSDSLHVSVGPGDHFDAHIDKYSPVPEHPDNSFCSNAPSPTAVGHITRELVPEWVRKKTGIPGFQLLPEPPAPVPVPEGAGVPGAVPELARITLRGPVKLRQQRSDAAPLPDDIERRLADEIPKRIRPNALIPPASERELAAAEVAREKAGPDEERALIAALAAARERIESFADAHDFAKDLARRMDQARRGGRPAFAVQLGQTYAELSPAEVNSILAEIRNIARIVRALLAERAGGVYKVWVLFGDRVMWDIDF